MKQIKPINKCNQMKKPNLLFQMFFGMPSRIIGKNSKAIHETLGFVGALIKIMTMTKPTHVTVLFDSEQENERAQISEDYKANRPSFIDVPRRRQFFSPP